MKEPASNDPVARLMAAVAALKTLAYGLDLCAEQTDSEHVRGCASLLEDIQARVYNAAVELEDAASDGAGNASRTKTAAGRALNYGGVDRNPLHSRNSP